jgi:hypothetical protein
MSDKPGMVKETVEVVAGIVKAVPVYQDAIQPAAQETGKALATPVALLNTALRPLKSLLLGVNLVFDRLDEAMTRRLAGVARERIVEPPANVAGPLLLGYAFVESEPLLREMFELLLATAMNADTRDQAHPSFVEIIRQLTPDEARILREIESKKDDAFACVRVDLKKFFQYRIQGILTEFDDLDGLSARDVAPLCISNIERLGLVKMQFLEPLSDKTRYQKFAGCLELQDAGKVAAEGEVAELTPGVISTTPFGQAFLRVCVAESADTGSG